MKRCIAIALTLACAIGCSREAVVSTGYGKRGGDGTVSVNGTSVLSRMFEQSGYRISTSRFLGHAVRTADIVVWCPDTFELPSDRVCRFFDDWLSTEAGRTLIYIGRDYDGAVDYWQQISQSATNNDAVPMRRRLAERMTEMEIIRAARPEKMDCLWFSQQSIQRPMVATSIRGLWSEVATTVDIPVYSALVSKGGGQATRDDALVAAGKHVLALRLQRPHWMSGQIVATASGAWLLNVALVNHGHRLLAQRLIDSCAMGVPPSERKVVFLESARNSPTESQSSNRPYWLEAFTVWPFNSILIHATLVGMVVCLATFPVFGRAREWLTGGQSDFGRHIRAIGRLTSATRDEAAAQKRRQAYWTMVKHKPLADLPPLESDVVDEMEVDEEESDEEAAKVV